MKKLLSVIFLVCCAFSKPVLPHKILFIGDSITYSGQYITYIETYFRLHYPDKEIEFINMGLPSETVSGLSEPGHAGNRFPRPDLHERLDRVLLLTKPDLVFACYGMNDGIYLPFDEKRFNQFKTGIVWMRNEVLKSGAKIVHLTPPVYDEKKGNAKSYAAVLDRYTDWLLSKKKEHWQVVDIHRPMKNYLAQQRKTDAMFFLAADGIHPNDAGHWLMAKPVLIFMGEKEHILPEKFGDVLKSFPNGQKTFQLINEKQRMLKDARLTKAGHKRPEMAVGMRLDSAEQKARETDRVIKALSANRENNP